MLPQFRIKEAKPACITPDVTLIAFRFWGKAPMVGFRDGRTFHIVWLDVDFSLYACTITSDRSHFQMTPLPTGVAAFHLSGSRLESVLGTERDRDLMPRGTNPNSLKNLRPYQKGVSGNPSGSNRFKHNPMGKELWRLLRHKLGSLTIDPEKDKGMTALCKRLIHMAIKDKNMYALREIFDRIDGPVSSLKLTRITDEAHEEIEAKLGTGDLIGAISSIYGIRIADTRTGITTTYSEEHDIGTIAGPTPAPATTNGHSAVIDVVPESGEREPGSTDRVNATLSLPEAVDRGPEPPKDS